MEDVQKKFLNWMQNSIFKEELSKMTEKEIIDAFSTQIEFGTGGLRGIMGPGTNRMNIYTIRKATYGFGKYLLDNFKNIENKVVVIAHDNRHNSSEFAQEAAKILSSFNIQVKLFPKLAPTPLLSYAVRYFKAIGGIVVTASHNPKEYNGYKVYDQTGCQLGLEKSDQLIKIINDIEDVFKLKFEVDSSKIEIIGQQVIEDYKKSIDKIRLIKEMLTSLKIVYTPLHGAAGDINNDILKGVGYEVHLVEKQAIPDPNFSNTISANPEEKNAYIEAIRLSDEVDADLILATDPDGDRIGVVVKDHGQYSYLTGNQTGGLLIDYILKYHQKNDNLANSIIYNTIVTSNFGASIALKYGVEVYSTLTGFKFIGEQIRLNEEKSNGKRFKFGYEESYGYLIAPITRDKDSIQAAVMIAEMANFYKLQGLTLVNVLNNLYQEYGYYIEDQINLSFKGIEGVKKIEKIIDFFRKNTFNCIKEYKIDTYEDYLNSVRIHKGKNSSIDLPKSNVIKLIFEDSSFIAARPSGTEPKCKIYLSVKGKNEMEAYEKLKLFKDFLNEKVATIE